MSNELDMLMDEVVSFLMGLEGVDENSVKIIDFTEAEIEDEMTKYS